MLKKDLQGFIVPIINGFNDKEQCTIKDFKLSSKIIKLKRFYKDDIEELQEQAKALNEKYIIPERFKLNEYGQFDTGDKNEYENFITDNKELLNQEINEYETKFVLEDFEGSDVAHWLLNLLDDADLLGD